ncbi:MAG: outer membrane protein assembly factor BamB [Pseudomonadales bacterium]|nr:outer membrane protein assembly factor BamB [Pseudomonadales bacterium]
MPLAALLLSLLVLLPGCGSTPQEREEAGKPMLLETIEQRVVFRKQWQRDIGAGQGRHYNRLTLAVTDAGACAASVNGRVACYTHDGEKRWARKLGEALSAGVGAAGERLFVASSDGEIIALAAGDGAELWRYDTRSEVLAAPQGEQGRVVVQTSEGRVLGLDAATGSKVWEFKNDEPLLTLRGTATPVVDQGEVYTGFASGKLVALDLASGELRWGQPVAIASGTAEIERLVDLDAAPRVTDEVVYAGSFNGNLFAFARRNGAPLWRFKTSTYREVAEGFGHVYLVDEDSRIYSINARDGEQRWENSKLLNRELSAPAVFAGYLLVADYDGYLHAISQVDGSLVGRTRVDGSGVRVPMRIADEQLYVYSNNGELAAYRLQPR